MSTGLPGIGECQTHKLSLQWDVCWLSQGPRYGVCVTWLLLPPAFNSPLETALFYFSVTPSSTELDWGDGEATQESQWNETVVVAPGWSVG